MIIFKDIFTGEELFSDSYKMEKIDGVFYKLVGKRITISGGIDESAIGGNASEEGGAEALEEASVTEINIIYSHKLQETTFKDKKEYQSYLKAYMGKVIKKLEESNPDRVAPFKAAVQPAVKKMVLDKYKDLQFYLGEEDYDRSGMAAILDYEEDGITPFLLYFIDGVVEEKF